MEAWRQAYELEYVNRMSRIRNAIGWLLRSSHFMNSSSNI